ncbi:MAG TPA: hypothetical protein EYM43_02135 [Alphaproteobacteria bacterium]|nr:hypothetical protein [Alphaproteobacteria bacterium]
MNDFSAAWLDLREPADLAARAPELLERLSEWSGQHEHVTVADLGSGTGSCLRAIAPQMSPRQSWRLIDRSGVLLDEAVTRLSKWAHQRSLSARVEQNVWRFMGKISDYSVVFEEQDLATGPGNTGSVVDLVTVSAVLDLVSKEWCSNLARWCSEKGAALYTCLNYDGQFHFAPSHPDDSDVRSVVNTHQRSDKGMGPALGSSAIEVLAEALSAAKYQFVVAPSPWLLGSDNSALQSALVRDWSDLVFRQGDKYAARVSRWRNFRMAAIKARQSHLSVGHVDLWAWPKA